MATRAEIRALLFDTAEPYTWSDTLIDQVLASEANTYRAAAKLLRAYCAKAAREPVSYRMTDGKSANRSSLAELLALADKYDEMAVQGGAFATVDGKFSVDIAGRDQTTFEDDA